MDRKQLKVKAAATGGSIGGAILVPAAAGAAGVAMHHPGFFQTPTKAAGIATLAGSGAGAGFGAHLAGADKETSNRAALAGVLAPGIGPALAMHHSTFRSGDADIGGRHNERDISRKKAESHRLYYMKNTGHGVKRVKYTYPDR